jgi:penicillin amidase
MWYEVEMKCGNTDFNVCGFSLPGAPGVIIGHNEKIAWGITNLMNDDADFYVLNRDPANRNKYLYNENSIFLDSTEEEIYIKDEKEPLYYFTYRTKLGPVISDLEKTNLSNETKFKVRGDQLLTFKWTGFEMTDETKAIYEINRADKWDKFRDALKSFGLPASNFTYADVNGNIGYQAAGLIPIRKNLESNSQQFYPSTEDIMWAGFVNFDELPKAFNPPEGYIVTANNKPLKDYKHYISNLYEPPYRAERIEALLKARNNFNAKEFELIQNDVVDLKAKEYCKYIFEAYKDSLNLNSEEKQCLDRLKKWDYAVNVFSTEASIISEFEIQLFKYLYKDKLGEELFEQYVQLNNIPIRNTLKILKEESSWLYDLSGTTRTEKREFIIKKSFRDAIDNLSKIFGTQDNTKWTWNELHKIEIRHPLGVVPALSPVLNVGPYDLGGCGTTIAYSGYSIFKAYKNNDFNSFVGQSCKFVIDLSNTSLHYSVIPTGQSGQPLHYNYKDQTRLWLSGQYKTVVSDIIELKKEKLSAITLAPY